MQIIDIDSIDDERVAAYTNLTELQLRNRLEPQKGIFIAESPKVIDRALAAGREPLSLLVERPWLEGMADTFAFIDAHWGPDVPVFVASPDQLRQLTGYRLHRGALAAMRRWPLPSPCCLRSSCSPTTSASHFYHCQSCRSRRRRHSPRCPPFWRC